MNVLIDIGHPAHVHIFRRLAEAFISDGNSVFFTVREGEKESELLSGYNLPFVTIGKKRKSRAGKLAGLFMFSIKIFLISRRKKSDIFLSHGSMYAGIASFFSGKPHIALEDTGNMEQVLISRPFSDAILSPDSLSLNLGKKHIKYSGFHEIYYLSPGTFNPNPIVKEMLGIRGTEQYCILRFISWDATHDFGHTGISDKEKILLIDNLQKRCRVFISSESALPPELTPLQFPLKPEWLHHAIAFSQIVISEGATVASESTLLGVPVIYINSRESDMITAHERWGLLTHFRKFNGLIDKTEEILSDRNSKGKSIFNRDRMLETQIDVSAFLKWFIENFPGSQKILAREPNYQDRFKTGHNSA